MKDTWILASDRGQNCYKCCWGLCYGRRIT